MMKTFYLKKENAPHHWYLIDAADQVVGRLAGKISRILGGKDTPEYTPGVDNGNFVVVINCEKVKMSGRKPWNKKYHTHSGYPGGLKVHSYQHLMEKQPERILLNAVKGMLPKNKLRDRFLARLRIHKGTEHPYGAQKPEPITLS